VEGGDCAVEVGEGSPSSCKSGWSLKWGAVVQRRAGEVRTGASKYLRLSRGFLLLSTCLSPSSPTSRSAPASLFSLSSRSLRITKQKLSICIPVHKSKPYQPEKREKREREKPFLCIVEGAEDQPHYSPFIVHQNHQKRARRISKKGERECYKRGKSAPRPIDTDLPASEGRLELHSTSLHELPSGGGGGGCDGGSVIGDLVPLRTELVDAGLADFRAVCAKLGDGVSSGEGCRRGKKERRTMPLQRVQADKVPPARLAMISPNGGVTTLRVSFQRERERERSEKRRHSGRV
jgi:hypothetical protein